MCVGLRRSIGDEHNAIRNPMALEIFHRGRLVRLSCEQFEDLAP
jgi:hypothetical protein